jgi:glycosyltransferase involved in cell wall biosynthesis
MKIAYVGMFGFPDGDAGTVHVLGVAKALRELGNEVVFFSNMKSAQNIPAKTRIEHYDGISTYEEFKYRPLEHSGIGIWGRLRRQASITTGYSVFQRLKIEESKEPVDALIAYQAQSLLFYRMLHWCTSRKIPLICDVVEWFDRNHYAKGGRYGYHALNSELNMRKLYFLSDGVLTISKYLENYYSSHGLPTLRVPNLIDILDEKWSLDRTSPAKHASKRLRLAFVGSAGKKDLLVNAIRGLSLVGAKECEIVVVGPSPEELRANLGPDSKLIGTLSGSLNFIGRLPHREALRQLAQADFSILLRPNAQFANAGFPTKLVESLAMGIPVICNPTGDIGLYVRDGYEGIVIQDASPEAFAYGVRRALSMSLDDRLAMRQQARKTAELSFDYRNWVAILGKFIDRVAANVHQKKILS